MPKAKKESFLCCDKSFLTFYALQFCLGLLRYVASHTLFETYSKRRILILAFSTNFCPIKIDLSGNTI